MSHEERNTFAGIITSLIVILYFGSKIRSNWGAGLYDGPNGASVWAQDVLWMIPFCIVLMIALTIAFNILHAIITNTPNPSSLTDERDTMIGRRGSIATMIVASMGFIAALIGMAMGWTALGGLNMILVSFAVADLVGNVTKVAAYRFGI